jgi:hypothetical protein
MVDWSLATVFANIPLPLWKATGRFTTTKLARLGLTATVSIAITGSRRLTPLPDMGR